MENEQKIGYVYMITSPSGRIYIGSTGNIKQRWQRYKRLDMPQQFKLLASFKKYSVEKHIFEIIWEGDYYDSFRKEAVLGHFYECLDQLKGLNLQLPGFDDLPCCKSKETRRKISEAQKLINWTEEKKKYHGSFHKGKVLSDKTKELMTKTRRKNKENNLHKIPKNSKKIICMKTNKIFQNLKEAAELNNIPVSSLGQMLKGPRKNKTTLKYYED